MTTQAKHIDEWLDKAFRLAFFLHGDRETAKTIAQNAMAKLETASNAQFKRYYYTPTGRAEASRATRNRVSLNDLHLLQRLVFVESEKFEREQEISESLSERNLLIYFIKHLVRISLKRNSFYVTLGISRILHSYGTADAMEIYNIVMQDPERVHDDYYYRSRKGVLMKELKERFGSLLKVVKVNRGEERFQVKPDCFGLTDAARESLKFFTPWNSSCSIPDEFDPFDDVIKPFHFDKADPDDEHRIEVNRIHATLHPTCFDRLTNALNLPAPEEKMEIPQFMFTPNQTTFDDNNWNDPPRLETDELTAIKSVLAAQAESRKAMSANLLRVVVDDWELVVVNLNERSTVKFDLDDGAELVEVRATGKHGESVLATHLLNFEDMAKGSQDYELVLEGGQKVSFNFSPTLDSYGEVVSLACGIGFAETAWQKRFALALSQTNFAFASFLKNQNWILKPALSFGAILMVLSLGWFVYQKVNNSDNRAVVVPNEKEQNETTNPAPPASDQNNNKPDIAQKKAPDNLVAANSNIPDITRKPQPRRADGKQNRKDIVPTPPNELQANSNNPEKETEYTDENAILRVPIRETNQIVSNERIETRGSSKLRGKSLAEIRLVYIELSGDAAFGQEIGGQIAAALQNSGTLRVTTDKEAADAALKVYVRHESDADTREEASVAAIVRLVNAKGFVVYPNVKRVSGWKYVGTAAKVPARIAKDLMQASEAASKK